MVHKAKSPPAATGGAPNALSCRLAEGNWENSISGLNLKELPSRATLARRWPGLKVNRLTWRWRDDASGAKGDDLQSLLAFLSEGGR